MASKRAQNESGNADKRKKKNKKSCEESAQLCPGVDDEQVTRAVKEAWSRRTHYSEGQ